MQTDGNFRPWREIARELAAEQDGTRLLKLARELDFAIEAQGISSPMNSPNEQIRTTNRTEK
jgi:hypothetical protein